MENVIFVINKLEENWIKELIKNSIDTENFNPIFVTFNWWWVDPIKSYSQLKKLIIDVEPTIVFSIWIFSQNIFLWQWIDLKSDNFKRRDVSFPSFWINYSLIPSYSFTYYESRWRANMFKDMILCYLKK